MANTDHSEELQTVIGSWLPDGPESPSLTQHDALQALEAPVYAVAQGDSIAYRSEGHLSLGVYSTDTKAEAAVGFVAPCTIAHLGSRSFCQDYNVQYPYYAGAMANGIASEDLVEAMAEQGFLAFFGSAGLSPARVTEALERLTQSLPDKTFGFNLINSPNDPIWQEDVVDLYLKYGLRVVEASAYVALSPGLVRYRVTGLHRDDDGNVVAPNHVIAKLSRLEVAKRFFEPAPDRILKKLLAEGKITEEEAELAKEIPMAQDITVEADSGGHTDHRPALTVLPSMLALRNEMQVSQGYSIPLRVGLGGGIGTPAAVAATFAMGAAYVVTGSINQGCIESGTTDIVRAMLAKASQTDVGQAPAADLFEMGSFVQVLKKGTRFTTRSNKLYDLYRTYPGIGAIPEEERKKLEAEILRKPIDAVWGECVDYFSERDPKQLEKAEANPKQKMALIFRWYLGYSSFWAKQGVADRTEDYQVWCGPAMGAFNEWVAGTFLEAPENRKVALVAKNLLFGAAVLTRANTLRQQGIAVEDELKLITPLSDEALSEHIG